MSKWNVATRQGLVGVDEVTARNPHFGSSGQLAAPPGFDGGGGGNGGFARVKDGQGDDEFVPFMQTRKFRLAVLCVAFFLLTVGLVVGFLYPRMPTFDIDRNAAVNNRTLNFNASYNNGSGLIYGSLIMYIYNDNYYDINVNTMDVTGVIGPDPDVVQFQTTITNLNMPSKTQTRYDYQVFQPLPTGINTARLTSYLVSKCFFVPFSLDMKMSGSATVSVLGTTLSISFGPQNTKAPCF